MFTTADIVRVRPGWYTIPVVTIMQAIESKYRSPREDGRALEALYFDVSISKFDKRDWIVSRRHDITLEQDKGFIAAYPKMGYSLSEMKQDIVDLANEWVEDNVEPERFDRLPEDISFEMAKGIESVG